MAMHSTSVLAHALHHIAPRDALEQEGKRQVRQVRLRSQSDHYKVARASRISNGLKDQKDHVVYINSKKKREKEKK